MDTQKTAHEEDAGMEKLERSAYNTTYTGLQSCVPERLHASLAQFSQSSTESGSAQPMVQGGWPLGPNEVQCWYCVAVLRTEVDSAEAVYWGRTYNSVRGHQLG